MTGELILQGITLAIALVAVAYIVYLFTFSSPPPFDEEDSYNEVGEDTIKKIQDYLAKHSKDK